MPKHPSRSKHWMINSLSIVLAEDIPRAQRGLREIILLHDNSRFDSAAYAGSVGALSEISIAGFKDS